MKKNTIGLNMFINECSIEFVGEIIDVKYNRYWQIDSVEVRLNVDGSERFFTVDAKEFDFVPQKCQRIIARIIQVDNSEKFLFFKAPKEEFSQEELALIRKF